jgi:BirA family biotin operon repressor/biotin-[acetyl-CoA-carboxylase] ligase
MKIIKLKTSPSTSQKAKELALKGVPSWTVILAEEQTAGYGRKGTGWFSPKGGLYFSIILPRSKIEDLQTLTILAAFIVAKTIKEIFSLEPLIKLPNDILLNGKKVCGILTENVIGRNVKLSVMGIGLNTNIEKFPRDLENSATSLKIELGRKVDNLKIIKQIVQGLKEQLRTISE